MFTFKTLRSAAGFLIALFSCAGAMAQVALPASANAKQEICGTKGCYVVELPKKLGKIKSVQSFPITKASKASALVSGTRGYAICAIPLWGSVVQCSKIDMPPLHGVKFKPTALNNGKYTITTYARGDQSMLRSYKAVARQFRRGFEQSKDALDARIEYSRPPTHSANRMQILADSISARSFASASNCPSGPSETDEGDDCDPVVIEGTCNICDDGDPEDPWEPEDPSDPYDEPEGPEVEGPAIENACTRSCSKQYDVDAGTCKNKKSKRLKALCHATMATKYGACLRGCED